jgi:putative FmdB family regulatory protein
MPMYDFKCSNCEHIFEENKKISERDDTTSLTCVECSTTGSITRMVGTPLVGYSISVNGGYGSKVPSGFKDVLNRIHERAPGSRMDKTSSFM